jgi:hypothetical protein
MFEALARIRHRRLRRDLSAYLDEMLSPGARRRLDGHLDTCGACRQELAELRATRGVLSDLPLAQVPRSFALAAAPQPVEGLRPAARRLEFGLRLGTAAAAFALAVVVIGDFAGLPGGEEEEEAAPVAMQRHEGEVVPGIVPAPTMEGEGRVFAPPMADEEEGVEVAPTPEEAPPELGYAAPEAGDIAEEEPTPESAPAPTGVEVPAARGAEEVAPEATPAPPIAEEPAAGAVEEVTPEATPAPPVAEEPAMESLISEDAAATPEAAVAEGEGALSREDVVRWLEIGLGAGVGVLALSWALVLRQVRIRAQ